MKKTMKKGMTLVEVLVAVAIFATALMMGIATTIQVNAIMYQNRVQNRLQEEAHYIMEYINREAGRVTDASGGGDSLTLGTKTLSLNGGEIKIGGDVLSGGDVKVTDFSVTELNVLAGKKPVFRVEITLEPAALGSTYSPYVAGKMRDDIQYSLQSTFSILD
jgi:prepilin-type N-terminal cleavage/methylation domain-containing protein